MKLIKLKTIMTIKSVKFNNDNKNNEAVNLIY